MEHAPGNALVRLVTTFEGHPLTIIEIDGRPHWIARQVGEALDYTDSGSPFPKMITREWSDELTADTDYRLLAGDELATVKALLGPDIIAPNTPSLLLLTQQGVFAASMLSRQPKARELRRWLSAEVLPQIAATGSFQPALPAPAQTSVAARYELLQSLRSCLPRPRYAHELGALAKASAGAVHDLIVDDLLQLAGADKRLAQAPRSSQDNPFVKLRLSRGLTQLAASTMLGSASRGTWGHYEQQQRTPRFVTVEKIFEVFHATDEEREEIRAWLRRES